jgi:hypothetical protein
MGLQTSNGTALRPGALHRARWMAKAIYSLKIELLFSGNESVLHLTAKELSGIRRFNRFVVNVYLQSWFTSRSVSDAPVNDLMLIQRLQAYSDENLKQTGTAMMKRHSWYLTPQLATVSLLSGLINAEEKTHLVATMQDDRGDHVSKSLPYTVSDLRISRTFFDITGLNCSFLTEPVSAWLENPYYKHAAMVVNNLPCVNDSAERGVALMQDFNKSVKDEEQKQFLLQVTEKHRQDFKTCDRKDLLNM